MTAKCGLRESAAWKARSCKGHQEEEASKCRPSRHNSKTPSRIAITPLSQEIVVRKPTHFRCEQRPSRWSSQRHPIPPEDRAVSEIPSTTASSQFSPASTPHSITTAKMGYDKTDELAINTIRTLAVSHSSTHFRASASHRKPVPRHPAIEETTPTPCVTRD